MGNGDDGAGGGDDSEQDPPKHQLQPADRFAAAMQAGGASLQFGIQMAADGSTLLAEKNPERVLDLATQVDAHAFEIATAREKHRHDEVNKRLEEEAKLESAEIKDRLQQRLFIASIVLATLVALGMLLFYGWCVADSKAVGDLLEKVLAFAGGAGGGFGLGLWRGNRNGASS